MAMLRIFDGDPAPTRPAEERRRSAPIRVPLRPIGPRARPQIGGAAEAPEPRSRRRQGWRLRYTRTSIVLDLAAGVLATVLANQVPLGGAAQTSPVTASLVFPALWVGLVAVSRAYEHRFIGVGNEETSRVFRAGLALMGLVAFVAYAGQLDFARGYVVVAVPSVVLLSLLGRCGQRSWLFRARRAGRCVERTVLAGSTAGVRTSLARLRMDRTHGIQVVAACVSDRSLASGPLGVPVTAGLDDIDTVAAVTAADLVAVLPSAQISGDQLRRLAWRLEASGTELVVCAGLTEVTGERITIRPTPYAPMLQVQPARLSGPARVVKSLFDRLAATFGLLLISPVMVAIALRIWMHDKHNPFFRQNRIGLNGREFGMWKFRTMVVNADRLKADLVAQNEVDGPLFKIADDPRVTPVGRKLRHYSLDELPQLINVILGQMSLVGPRPPLAHEVNAYGDDMRRRLLVKPGMTGLWQVSGRSDLSWSEAEVLDLHYVENWSLGHDFTILWRTVRVVATGDGAY